MANRKRYSEMWENVRRLNPQPGSLDLEADYYYSGFLENFRVNPPGVPFGNPIELTNHYTSAVFLAIHTLARQAAQAQVSLQEKDHPFQDDHIPVAPTDPLTEFIADPNPDEDFCDILEQATVQFSLTGMGIVWTPMEGRYDIPPNEMYVLPTASVLPQPMSPRFPRGAWLVQPWFPAGPYSLVPSYQGVGAMLPAEEVHVIKSVHPLFRWTGYAVLTAIGRQVDILDAVDLARWNASLNGMDPSFAITFDPNVKAKLDKQEIERIRRQLKQVARGPEHAGEPFIVPPGGNITKIANAPAEMAYQESWSQLLEFILACYGIPKSVANLTEGSSYAQVYAALKQFHLLTLVPHLRKIARTFNKKIIHPYFDRRQYLHLDAEAINDDTIREQQLANDDKIGLRTINERRKQRNLPAVPWGDERAWPSPSKPEAGPAREEVPGDSEKTPTDPDLLAVGRARPAKEKPGLAATKSTFADRLRDYRPLPNGRKTFIPNGRSNHTPRDN